MESYSLADAKARLSELVGKVEAGQTVEITKRGKPVAKIVPADRAPKPFDWDDLKRFTDGQPMQNEGAGEFIRRMRDDARY